MKTRDELIAEAKNKDGIGVNAFWDIGEICIETNGPLTVLHEQPQIQLFDNGGKFEFGAVQHGELILTAEQAQILIGKLQEAVKYFDDMNKLVEENCGIS